ncbi:hypothetical protein ACFE04_004483 [Oxalis oulophora]
MSLVVGQAVQSGLSCRIYKRNLTPDDNVVTLTNIFSAAIAEFIPGKVPVPGMSGVYIYPDEDPELYDESRYLITATKAGDPLGEDSSEALVTEDNVPMKQLPISRLPMAGWPTLLLPPNPLKCKYFSDVAEPYSFRRLEEQGTTWPVYFEQGEEAMVMLIKQKEQGYIDVTLPCMVNSFYEGQKISYRMMNWRQGVSKNEHTSKKDIFDLGRGDMNLQITNFCVSTVSRGIRNSFIKCEKNGSTLS